MVILHTNGEMGIQNKLSRREQAEWAVQGGGEGSEDGIMDLWNYGMEDGEVKMDNESAK